MSPEHCCDRNIFTANMTWVIGTPSSMGYGIAISDVRVTFPDGTTHDCLQKIYPVGRFITAGFAGSVAFGFWAIGNLQQQLGRAEPGHAWVPGWVAFKWFRLARRVFGISPPHVKAKGAAIMLVGVSPTVDVGIPGWARATVAIMQAPDFFPRILRLQEVGAIGSGSGVELYIRELEQLQRNPYEIWQAEVGMPGGFGRIVLHNIQQTILQNPSTGISHHLHLCLVRRGEITLIKSDHSVVPPNGPEIEVRMPRVATTWAEFKEMCSETSEATQAKC